MHSAVKESLNSHPPAPPPLPPPHTPYRIHQIHSHSHRSPTKISRINSPKQSRQGDYASFAFETKLTGTTAILALVAVLRLAHCSTAAAVLWDSAAQQRLYGTVRSVCGRACVQLVVNQIDPTIRDTRYEKLAPALLRSIAKASQLRASAAHANQPVSGSAI